MEIIIFSILLGPWLAAVLNSRPSQNGGILAFTIANFSILAVWAIVSLFLFRSTEHWFAMLVSWLGLLLIQGAFFLAALDGTSTGRSLNKLLRELISSHPKQ